MREEQRSATGASRMAVGPNGSPGQSHIRGITVATIAAVLMTITGALGTDDVPLLPRLGYWLVLMLSGALIGIGVTSAITSWGRLAPRPIVEGTLVSILIAAPLTLLVMGTSLVFFGQTVGTPLGIARLFGLVLVVTGAITAVNYATARSAAQPDPDPDTPPPIPARPRLAERLPPHLRDAAIHAVAAEDHYLRVHTAAGSDLILLRLSDAVSELDGIEGARTHRSWWVARDAIQSVERGDGRAELTLPGGIVAPVSRSYYPALRDAGWLSSA
ncbi:LytTR family DNA-binding domain-containing protein [Sphingosinithalassobacter portus]|uniref:LytTR family DNA-binding domain-containing protein n=1 Tax=Stakelama portus TaxID=2676234 RepID=UPI00195F7F84|nr:LytTR family DNA-binding domain-containing protein [Sphingosinithalassobacter portus]